MLEIWNSPYEAKSWNWSCQSQSCRELGRVSPSNTYSNITHRNVCHWICQRTRVKTFYWCTYKTNIWHCFFSWRSLEEVSLKNCSAASKLLGSIIWPVTSNLISITSLIKGLYPHPRIEIRKDNFKTKEAPLIFQLTYTLVSKISTFLNTFINVSWSNSSFASSQ